MGYHTAFRENIVQKIPVFCIVCGIGGLGVAMFLSTRVTITELFYFISPLTSVLLLSIFLGQFKLCEYTWFIKKHKILEIGHERSLLAGGGQRKEIVRNKGIFIAKGTTDPSVEFISQVQTQI